MKKTKNILFAFLSLCLTATMVGAQNSNIVKKDLPQSEIDRIVKSVTAKEAEFRAALKNYVFQRKAVFQTIGMGGQVTGVYRRESVMNLTGAGERVEKILYFPMPTMKEMTITPEDLEDLGGVNPFALQPDAVGLYNFTYVGKEKIDELDLYVLDVAPKAMPTMKSKIRLFSGRIWVDDADLQIVKSKGKAVPEDKNNKYPVVETWRENVDGKYWFPSFSSSDDELVFGSGQVVKLKLRVTYSGYNVGTSDVKILDGEEEVVPDKAVPDKKETAKPSPTPPAVKKP